MDGFGKVAEIIERVTGAAGEIQLQRRGEDYEIIYNGIFLMATYNGASEMKAVKEALEGFSSRYYHSLRVLMGGLGMGFSLKEALRFHRVEKVTVAEIEQAVIRWNYRWLNPFNKSALYDSRTAVLNADFYEVLNREAWLINEGLSSPYHLVLVDTDNGSNWLSLPSNRIFYSKKGLSLIKKCLVSEGIGCFWCPQRETDLEAVLENIFDSVSFRKVKESTGREGCYYLAKRPLFK